MKKQLNWLIFLLIFLIGSMAIGCKNSSSSGDTAKPTPTPDPNTEIEEAFFPIRENLVPVGYSSFPLGVPGKFPHTDDAQAEGVGYRKVARSVRRIATNELFTFPEQSDPELVYESVKFFIDNGHQVTHEIHILCGPCMRDRNDKFINEAAGKVLSQRDFVNELFFNVKLQKAVLSKFEEAVNHAKRLEELGATVYISPDLEHRHTQQSFQILVDFLRAAGWTNPDGSPRLDRIVSNGVDPYLSSFPGIRKEFHVRSLTAVAQMMHNGQMRPGDFINTDGKSFYFEGNTVKSHLFSEGEIREFIKVCEANNIIFYAWYGPLQGLAQVDDYGYIPINATTGMPDRGALRDRAYLLDKPYRLASMLMGISEDELRARMDQN